VLKLLGVTPLGRPRLMVAKIGAVVAVELVQFAILVPVAFLLGWIHSIRSGSWRPRG
jgi:ABC-2 type transport system permease protein